LKNSERLSSKRSRIWSPRKFRKGFEWTHSEDELLVELFNKYGFDWEKATPYFPNRTTGSIQARYYSLLRKGNSKFKTNTEKRQRKYTKYKTAIAGRNAWTHAEDELLMELFDKYGTDWEKFASQLPNRTIDSIQGRYYNILSKGNKESTRTHKKRKKSKFGKGTLWTHSEDEFLIELSDKYGADWEKTTPYFPNRTAGSIQSRYYYLLKKGNKKFKKETKKRKLNWNEWTSSEDELLVDLFNKYGNEWERIKPYLPTRTTGNIQSRYYYLLRKGTVKKTEIHEPKKRKPYRNKFKKNEKKCYRWTEEEDQRLAILVSKNGHTWKEFPSHFPVGDGGFRSSTSLKARYYSKFHGNTSSLIQRTLDLPKQKPQLMSDNDYKFQNNTEVYEYLRDSYSAKFWLISQFLFT